LYLIVPMKITGVCGIIERFDLRKCRPSVLISTPSIL